MNTIRAAMLAVSAAGIVATAWAQPGDKLPPGLVRQGNVIMMQPIQDTGQGPAANFGGERREGLVHVLSASDHAIFEQAFDASERGDWTGAQGLAAGGADPTAKKLVQWRYLIDRNSGAAFAQIAAFLRDNPDWPDRDALEARAEAAIDPAAMDPHAIVAWFGDRAPQTGIGNIRLGEALIAAGSDSRGRELIRKGWIEGDFDPSQEFTIIQKDGSYLGSDADVQRLDTLLWDNNITSARRELSRVPAGAQRVAQVRIALRSSPSAGLREIASLPADDRDDPGVLFDKARALRITGSVDQVPHVLAQAPMHEIGPLAPSHVWSEINLDARQQLSENNYRTAYRLAANGGIPTDAEDYSDEQFLAGWIALRYLKEPAVALTHFQNLTRNVSRPISKARGRYWEGRAHEAAGNITGAYASYRRAAEHPETFYGQLALAKMSPDPMLELRSTPVEAAVSVYEKDELTRAVRVLADLGLETMLRVFAVHQAEIRTNGETKALCENLTRMGFKEIALRVAKAESYTNDIQIPYLYPIIAVPAYVGPYTAPDQAYTLGIIRQETEFDPASVSGPGARGLMQLMPSSARMDAAKAGLEYRPNDLLSDIDYNMKLGQVELSVNLNNWTGSYILAAAAYNAGPGNARKWVDQFGDPRNSSVDPIDWIEHIPFGETRNYVMRVIENMEVYRARLAGHPVPLRILADIYRPNAPQTGALHYSPPAGAQTGDADSSNSSDDGAQGNSAANRDSNRH
ncbi:MAG TPA: lytic transglycosylase domain-containing protein [Rhizomicrobium sp.]|jgi:soluble lytic murein transglycosylase